MAKAYWVVIYHAIKDPEALAAYAKIAAPAVQAAGGRFIVRGAAARAYEGDKGELRTVVVEFDSLEKAIAVHDGAAYQRALKVLGDGAARDFRIVEGAA
jgi:uncharacterized protein (DUF1330 family)